MAALVSSVWLSVLLFCFNLISVNLGADICFLENYETFNLTQREWRVILPNNKCLYPNNQTNCVVTFIFCQPLANAGNCTNASVCQNSTEGFFKMATYNPKRPFQALTNGRVGFESVFDPGSAYNGSGRPCQMKTSLNFVCDETTLWLLDGKRGISSQDVPTKPNVTLIPASCEFNMTFKYAGACAKIYPIIVTTQLSAGTVLVIIFMVFLFIYFVFGSIWNIGCKGARGIEAVPHYDFWTDLPVLVADGFLFTFRCGRLDTTGTTYESI